MIEAEVRRVSSLEANPAATSARGTNFVGPDRFQPSVPVSQTIDETGRAMWPLPAAHGWLLFGPYLVVMAGIYRIKALAKVEGSANEVAYFDIFDGANNSATYASAQQAPCRAGWSIEFLRLNVRGDRAARPDVAGVVDRHHRHIAPYVEKLLLGRVIDEAVVPGVEASGVVRPQTDRRRRSAVAFDVGKLGAECCSRIVPGH